jgi:hypothetical protein
MNITQEGRKERRKEGYRVNCVWKLPVFRCSNKVFWGIESCPFLAGIVQCGHLSAFPCLYR